MASCNFHRGLFVANVHARIFGSTRKFGLFLGLGFSTFSGIVFYIYLRTSPQGDILIGQNQQMQNSWAALSEEDRIARRQSTKLMLQDIFLVSVLQNAPIILGAAIMILPKEKSALTLGLGAFMIGFSGILRIVVRPKNVPSELYWSKSRIIGNILLTVFAWSFAIYTLFQGLASP